MQHAGEKEEGRSERRERLVKRSGNRWTSRNGHLTDRISSDRRGVARMTAAHENSRAGTRVLERG